MSGVEGLPTLIAKIRALGDEGNRIEARAVNVVADMVVADAKRNAPKDLGTIAQNIGKSVTNTGTKVTAKIFSAAPESAYQEFGTGGRVIVPPLMADVANTFKGKSGGDFKAFVKALTGWVKRKGIAGVYSVKTRRKNNKLSGDADEQAAYLIARSILRKGLKPQPFLFPAWMANKDKLLPLLQAEFTRALRR